MGTPMGALNNDGTLCGCFDDMETCCITTWCACITFGMIRERAGIGDLIGSALMFFIPVAVLNGIARNIIMGPYSDRLNCVRTVGLQGCDSEMAAYQSASHIANIFQILSAAWIAALVGNDRNKLQQLTGKLMPPPIFWATCTPRHVPSRPLISSRTRRRAGLR